MRDDEMMKFLSYYTFINCERLETWTREWCERILWFGQQH